MIHRFRAIRNMYRTLGFRGIWASIRARITGKTVIFNLKRPDCKHPIQLRIPSSDVSTYEQIFINNEYDFISKEQPKVIIDAGANIGLAAIYFTNKYCGAKIIAIEPERSNFEFLKENTEMYPNIIPVHAALWNKNEEVNIVDPGLGKWGFMTELKNSTEKLQGNDCHAVSAITVDKIISDYKIERIDVLKIDIEGAEREVFSDTSSWIDKVDSIIIELHERMKRGCNRSFYQGSNGFDDEWLQGENIYLSRKNCISKSVK